MTSINFPSILDPGFNIKMHNSLWIRNNVKIKIARTHALSFVATEKAKMDKCGGLKHWWKENPNIMFHKTYALITFQMYG